VSDEAEHRRDNSGRPLTDDEATAVTRGEYQKNQEHLDEVLQLRRAQDLKLLEFLENTCNTLSDRFTDVETAVREMHSDSKVQQTMFEEFKARQEKHEDRIGELEKGYASLKAWILIVGGITGVASFLAIALR
jgi:chromosome segregation ATPase